MLAGGRNTMGHVIFQCPKTGEEFDSGFQAGPHDMRASPPAAKIHLRCKVCGAKHEFEFADARVDENDHGRPNQRSPSI